MSLQRDSEDVLRVDENGERWVRERQGERICCPISAAQIETLRANANALGATGEFLRLGVHALLLELDVRDTATPMAMLIRPKGVSDDGPGAYRLDEKGRVLVFRWPAPGLIAEPLGAGDFGALAERYENAAALCDEQGRQIDAFTRCVRADYLRSVAARLSPEHYGAAVPTYSPSTAGAA